MSKLFAIQLFSYKATCFVLSLSKVGLLVQSVVKGADVMLLESFWMGEGFFSVLVCRILLGTPNILRV